MKHWQNIEVKYHKECTRTCYRCEPRCPLCPEKPVISDKAVRTALWLVAFMTAVVVTCIILKIVA